MLIDVDNCTGPEAEALLVSSIVDLKRRLDKALGSCRDDGTPALYKARVVMRLKNGGILMELESDEAMEWFTHSSIWKNFMAGLRPAPSGDHQTQELPHRSAICTTVIQARQGQWPARSQGVQRHENGGHLEGKVD